MGPDIREDEIPTCTFLWRLQAMANRSNTVTGSAPETFDDQLCVGGFSAWLLAVVGTNIALQTT